MQAIIDQRISQFRDDIRKWRINKQDDDSHLIDKELQAVLQKGFYAIIEGQQRALDLPKEHKVLDAITRAIPALALEGDIHACAMMRAYRGNRDQAAWHLMGSTIASALTTAKEAGLINEELFKISEKYFDKPYKAPFKARPSTLLNDATIRQAVDTASLAFRKEMRQWRLQKSVPSPTLTPEVIDAMTEAFYDQIKAFDEAQNPAHKDWKNWIIAGPMLTLQDRLRKTELIATYNGPKETAIYGLMGSVIKHAITTGRNIGIDNPYVLDDYRLPRPHSLS